MQHLALLVDQAQTHSEESHLTKQETHQIVSFPSNYQVSKFEYCKIPSIPVRNTKICVKLLLSFTIKSRTLPPLTRMQLKSQNATLRRQTAPPALFGIFVPANETLLCST